MSEPDTNFNLNAPTTVPVSAVIPCFRCSSTVVRAVASIAQQTTKPAEVILIDDASGDDTLPVLQKLAQENPGWVKVLQLNENQGAASARNAGWNIARQPYIAFLDADDAWHHQKIQIQYEWMLNNPKIMLVGHQSIQKKECETESTWDDDVRVKHISKFQLLLVNSFSTRTVMVRREIPIQFDTSKRYMEDYWWLLQIVFSNIKICRIELPLAFTFKSDYGESGLSSKLWEMEKNELDNYWRLYKGGMIAFPLIALLTIYSLMKYLRRVLISRTQQFIRGTRDS